MLVLQLPNLLILAFNPQDAGEQITYPLFTGEKNASTESISNAFKVTEQANSRAGLVSVPQTPRLEVATP